MAKATLSKSTFQFLKDVKANNNRDWFNAHKDRYLGELARVEQFADALILEVNKHDVIETETGKKSLHRIYRDTRFSKEKTPYKTNWSGSLTRATKLRRGSYYFHIEPGKSFVGGGFWGPEPGDLRRIRDEFAYDASPLRKILKSKSFVSNFGSMHGEQLKTAPRGYEPDNEAIDLIRYKQFLLSKKFTDQEVLSDDFLKKVNDTFKAMRPFLDYMTDVLTTDVNGIQVE